VFVDEIKIYESLFEKDLLNNFFKYWKEKSPGGNKNSAGTISK